MHRCTDYSSEYSENLPRSVGTNLKQIHCVLYCNVCDVFAVINTKFLME